MSKKKPWVYDLIVVNDMDGILVCLENEFDFEIKRIFWIKDVPSGQTRANHSCMNSDFVYVCVQGRVVVELKHSQSEYIFELECCDKMLYVPSGWWVIARNFSTDAILMVVSNQHYRDSIYIDDFAEYSKLREDDLCEKGCDSRL